MGQEELTVQGDSQSQCKRFLEKGREMNGCGVIVGTNEYVIRN